MPRFKLPIGLLSLAATLFSVVANGASPTFILKVKTSDGRQLRGVLDERSDESTLWLRMEEGNIALSVPVDWNSIVDVRRDDVEVEVAKLRAERNEAASAGPQLATLEPPASAAVVQAAYVAPRTARVRNLEIVEACLVNLDRDVEPDGLSVTIIAIGHDGAPIAVRGSLRAELHGERQSVSDPSPRFEELGRWTQRVKSEDFIDGAATYYLPFRSVAPEWEFDVVPDAVLTVQLGASGHGNFSASAPVVLRQFNPLRDELQQWQGTRFVPNEVRGAYPGPQREGRWLWWGR